jgi:hypothetical protein
LRRKEGGIPRKVMSIKIRVEIKMRFENRDDDGDKLREIVKKYGRAWEEAEVFGKPQTERPGP